MTIKSIDYQLLADAVRMLSVDAISHVKSGHPGMPMGMAEIGITLWYKHLKHNPNNHEWINRDRFILSNGHGSMLLYSLLHLSGYSISIQDVKSFRQLHSITPGHPEYKITPGVDVSTGPLGQGLANGVGMALAERLLSNEFNKENLNIIDHYTYVFVGDGCLMEGISHEACSLAGTLKLSKLIVIYDSNNISIDGVIDSWFSENIVTRFLAYNWQVIEVDDGHNINDIDKAINQAKLEVNKPSIIICKTIIGKGSVNFSGTEKVHGTPFDKHEIKLIRDNLNWQYQEFVIPEEVYTMANLQEHGSQLETTWNELFKRYTDLYPHESSELLRRITHTLPNNFSDIINVGIESVVQQEENISTRKASLNAITFYARYLPELFGGSADLSHSNLTKWQQAIALTTANKFLGGNYINYGVREFAATAMVNGMYIHGGYKPFFGTFLAFSDYARNAARMASLMHIAPIFVYTHDSIYVGEDGPTHQPVEQILSLRAISNMQVWRPCDTVETIIAWGFALMQSNQPTSLIFSRQDLKFIKRDKNTIKNIIHGGYILHTNAEPANVNIVIIATGSEVSLALDVYNAIIKDNHCVQLVSMPSTTTFDMQSDQYKQSILPVTATYKIVIEAAKSDFWYKYVGLDGLIIGIDHFGCSGKDIDVAKEFGFTFEQVLYKVNKYISNEIK